MDWWPSDSNTAARLHIYSSQTGGGLYDMNSKAAADAYCGFLQLALDRIGCPMGFMEEFGFLNTVPGWQTQQANLRRAALGQQLSLASWAMSDIFTGTRSYPGSTT